MRLAAAMLGAAALGVALGADDLTPEAAPDGVRLLAQPAY
jgi:hypothetical protein